MATDQQAAIERIRQQLIDKGVDPREADELARLRVELDGVNIGQRTVTISTDAPASNRPPLPFQSSGGPAPPPSAPAAAGVRDARLLGGTITAVGPSPSDAQPFARQPVPATPFSAAPQPSPSEPALPPREPRPRPIAPPAPRRPLTPLPGPSVASFSPTPPKPESLAGSVAASPAPVDEPAAGAAPAPPDAAAKSAQAPAVEEPAVEAPPSPAAQMHDAFAAARSMLEAMQAGGDLSDPNAVGRALVKLSRTEDAHIGRFAKKLPHPIEPGTLVAMRDVLRFCGTILAGEAEAAAHKRMTQLAELAKGDGREANR